MAMVSTSMPSAKPDVGDADVGPCRVSGPREIGPPAVVARPGAAGSSVKVWVRPGDVLAGRGRYVGSAAQVLRWSTPGWRSVPRKVTTMLPGLNRSMVLLGRLVLKK